MVTDTSATTERLLTVEQMLIALEELPPGTGFAALTTFFEARARRLRH